jgi:N-acetyl-anhydromuramyl-L-alanine amidase AmpD
MAKHFSFVPRADQPDTLAPGPGALLERERQWLQALREGLYQCLWRRVGSVFWSTAIKVEGMRVTLSYTAALEAARILGARLPTKVEADAMFKAARHVTPIHVTPASTAIRAIELHSFAVDGLIGDGDPFVDNEGKLWLAGAPAGLAMNYGWVDHPASDDGDDYEGAMLRANGLHMWQDVGQAHISSHVDYSQTLRFVRDCPLSSAPHDTESSMPVVREPLPTQKGEGMPPQAPSDAVKDWQTFLNAMGYGPLVPDGKHWTATQSATEAYHRDQRPTMPPMSLPAIKFRQAKHYHPGRVFGSPSLIVIHTAEMIERSDGAEALQAYAATMPDGRVASWHYSVDNDTITQSVRDEDTAFAAPGTNENGIHIELCGFARQSPEEWGDMYSRKQLPLVASLVAALCERWRIPVIKVEASDLAAGARLDSKGRLTAVNVSGLCGHSDASRAFKRSTHGDPGLHFPWSKFLKQIRELSEVMK